MTIQSAFPRKKVALIHLGCAKNLVDSEVMLGYLHDARYDFVRSPADADIVIVNTCGFIRPARDEADSVLGKLARLEDKTSRKEIRRHRLLRREGKGTPEENVSLGGYLARRRELRPDCRGRRGKARPGT